MTIPLVPITRPNGKVYRPRKIVVVSWDNDEATGNGDWGVYVIGTHDIDASRPLAADGIRHWFGTDQIPVKPFTCWVRDGFRYGDRWWVDDDVRGRAAVCWTAGYPEDQPT